MATQPIHICGEHPASPSDASSEPIPRVALGMAPMLLLYVAYCLVHWLVRTRGPIDGLRNAHDLLDLERRLGLDR